MLRRARPGLFAGKSPACGSVRALRQMPAHIESPVHFPSLAVDNQTRVLSLWESKFTPYNSVDSATTSLQVQKRT